MTIITISNWHHPYDLIISNCFKHVNKALLNNLTSKLELKSTKANEFVWKK